MLPYGTVIGFFTVGIYCQPFKHCRLRYNSFFGAVRYVIMKQFSLSLRDIHYAKQKNPSANTMRRDLLLLFLFA